MPSTNEIPDGYYLKISKDTADAINALDEDWNYWDFFKCKDIVKDSLMDDIESPEIIHVYNSTGQTNSKTTMKKLSKWMKETGEERGRLR